MGVNESLHSCYFGLLGAIFFMGPQRIAAGLIHIDHGIATIGYLVLRDLGLIRLCPGERRMDTGCLDVFFHGKFQDDLVAGGDGAEADVVLMLVRPVQVGLTGPRGAPGIFAGDGTGDLVVIDPFGDADQDIFLVGFHAEDNLAFVWQITVYIRPGRSAVHEEMDFNLIVGGLDDAVPGEINGQGDMPITTTNANLAVTKAAKPRPLTTFRSIVGLVITFR